ncbi:MAG: transcription termination/antitermination NusG family protein [Mariprofundaceae bacterium]
MSRQWFAVRCKPRREFEALAAFVQQGFEAWLPQELKMVRHARRMEKKPRPFFPGYLVLHLAPAERRWTTIRSTRGAVGAVRFGDLYPPVPDDVVAALRAMEDAQGYIRPPDDPDPECPFAPGERVRIREGAMAGIEGVFLARDGEQRAMVLLAMLQRQVKAKLPLAVLKTA